MENRIKELKDILKTASYAYYFTDKPLITDYEFDELQDELLKLAANDEYFTKIGVDVSNLKDSVELPVQMGSMAKIKEHKDLDSWIKSKKIPLDTEMIISLKYNGMSFLKDYIKSDGFTRGDGSNGFKKNEHIVKILQKYKINVGEVKSILEVNKLYVGGEIILDREAFKKYADDFELVLNLVASAINSDYKDENLDKLQDLYFMQYHLTTEYDMDKDVQLNILNQHFNKVKKVEFVKIKYNEITADLLKELYLKWSKDFEIDGLIIEVNDKSLRNKLGMSDVKLVPNYARAYKVDIEEKKETIIKRLEYGVGKYGVITPVAWVEPIKLDGAVVNKVTCCNISMVERLGLGENAKILMRRSGMIIPQILKVILKSKDNVISKCPSCGSELVYNKTGVNLMCVNERCHEQRIKKIISFFEILDAKNLGEASIRLFYENGFDSVKKILQMTIENFLGLDGFKDSKSQKIFDTIKTCCNGVELCKLQHASSYFPNLGSKKLKLLEGFKEIPTYEQLLEIDGIGEESAKIYLKNIEKFNNFYNDLEANNLIKLKAEILYDGDLNGKSFVFTGIRRKDLEKIIIERGGIISDGLNKTTSFLVMKEKGSGSNKEEKAIKYGTEIITVQELETLLNK